MASNFPDTQPPAINPDTGAIWTSGDTWIDPATSIIYVWTPPVWKTDYTPNAQADAKYVEVAGDNMEGNLTLGTDRITLNATNGSATFGGSVTVGDELIAKRINFNYKGGKTGPILQIFEGLETDDATSPEIKFNNDGSASFSGGRFEINPNGSLYFAYDDAANSASNGFTFVTGDGGSANRPTFKLNYGGTSAITLSGDGSASFAGDITANNVTFAAGTPEELDVKDRLTKADTALQTLKTAAAAATDFASLKAAIATALADV